MARNGLGPTNRAQAVNFSLIQASSLDESYAPPDIECSFQLTANSFDSSVIGTYARQSLTNLVDFRI